MSGTLSSIGEKKKEYTPLVFKMTSDDDPNEILSKISIK